MLLSRAAGNPKKNLVGASFLMEQVLIWPKSGGENAPSPQFRRPYFHSKICICFLKGDTNEVNSW